MLDVALSADLYIDDLGRDGALALQSRLLLRAINFEIRSNTFWNSKKRKKSFSPQNRHDFYCGYFDAINTVQLLTAEQ